jgi:hypothetical protein
MEDAIIISAEEIGKSLKKQGKACQFDLEGLVHHEFLP